MTPFGLLEPGAVKVARRVLRGPRRSNAPGLPDLAFGAIAHNLARWCAKLGGIDGHLSRSGRRTKLHLVEGWPWEEAFLAALGRLRALVPLLA